MTKKEHFEVKKDIEIIDLTPDNIAPGTVVRTYRENLNLTQIQLAKKAGVGSAAYISDIENGRRPVSRNLAKKFSELFGVSVEMFV